MACRTVAGPAFRRQGAAPAASCAVVACMRRLVRGNQHGGASSKAPWKPQQCTSGAQREGVQVSGGARAVAPGDKGVTARPCPAALVCHSNMLHALVCSRHSRKRAIAGRRAGSCRRGATAGASLCHQRHLVVADVDAMLLRARVHACSVWRVLRFVQGRSLLRGDDGTSAARHRAPGRWAFSARASHAHAKPRTCSQSPMVPPGVPSDSMTRTLFFHFFALALPPSRSNSVGDISWPAWSTRVTRGRRKGGHAGKGKAACVPCSPFATALETSLET